MSPDQILPFALFALVTSITPGPNNVMLTALGANFGFTRGLPCAFGVSVGFSLMLALVIAGPGTLILANPAILDAVRWLGVAFLLWLAWKVATAKPAATGAPARRPVGFLGAAAFQWVNPKAWLIVAGATAAYLDPATSALWQSAAMGALFFVACAPSCLIWLGFGAALQRLLHSPARLRAFNVSMALLLAASVALFVT